MIWKPLHGRAAILALGGLYVLSAMTLSCLLPGPLSEFECMVIGTGSTGVTMAAFFLGCIARWRS